ncbi:MAG TPA: gamma-glutamyltransferase [Gemmataceae bacterium]|jgi:gamma-glutamyltranspeptidase/glutathione hydrolase
MRSNVRLYLAGICILACLLLVVVAPAHGAATAEGRRGMVVSVAPEASVIGRDILKQGGNAVDAAVATAFALAVVWPEAGNIGGGGFMLVYPGGKSEPVVIDYRETAPAAATRTMFADGKKLAPVLLVGTPGTVRGLTLAHRRFGKLAWKDLLAPAIRLAEEGFAIDAALADSLNRVLARSPDFAELRRVYGKDGDAARWQAGDRLAQKELAKTLRLIAEQGADGFYKGVVADLIAAEMKRDGGLITKADLAAYEAKVRKPIHGTYRGYDVYGPPPPSSGGMCLIEMLNVLENFDLRKHGRFAPETLHLTIETMRRAYCDRARYLGDPDFVKVPDFLTSKDHARQLARSIDPRKPTRSEELAKDIPLVGENNHTTHFSIIDKDGMAVANTYTLESAYGSRIVVRGAGFLLNDEMGDFNPRPGVTDRRGRIGTTANEIAPRKRMLSSQTPTIVAKDGKVVLVTGSPGGRTIINTVLCVVLNVLEFDMPLRDAVDAPRLHHQWFPDALRIEPELTDKHADALRKLRDMGHVIESKPARQGDAHSIRVDPRSGLYQGVADRRRDGSAAGY